MLKDIGLQFFADSDPNKAEPPPAQQQAKPEDIANALLSALENRTKRVEAGVLKSMAEQYGMSESELTGILEAEKAKKAQQLPEAVQQQVDKANKRLVSAEVKVQGAALGLVDADTAMLLLDTKGVKINDEGTVTGVKEALEALKKLKPFLFGGATTKTGMR